MGISIICAFINNESLDLESISFKKSRIIRQYLFF